MYHRLHATYNHYKEVIIQCSQIRFFISGHFPLRCSEEHSCGRRRPRRTSPFSSMVILYYYFIKGPLKLTELFLFIRLLSVIVNSAYSFWWDVTHDWGLELLKKRPRASQNHGPPRTLILPSLQSANTIVPSPPSPLHLRCIPPSSIAKSMFSPLGP